MNLAEAVEVLSRTPAAFDGMLRGIDEAWARTSSGPGVWSPSDIVGHLIIGERIDWIPRARIILEHGESHPFEPFEREAMLTAFADRSLDALLDEFASARAQRLAELKGLRIGTAELAARGTHPELGRVTLSQLIAAWAVHDLAHIAQAAEVMAKRYRDAAGPWRRFMPIVDRPDVEGD